MPDPSVHELQVAAISSDRELVESLKKVGASEGLVIGMEDSSFQVVHRAIEGNVQAVLVDLDALSVESMSAIGLLRRMVPEVPLVLTTSREELVDNGKILEEGFFYFSLKPLGEETLREVFEAAARRIGLSR